MENALGENEFWFFDIREENLKIGWEEFDNFSFFTFFILINKMSYRMYFTYIYQILLLQNRLCTFL